MPTTFQRGRQPSRSRRDADAGTEPHGVRCISRQASGIDGLTALHSLRLGNFVVSRSPFAWRTKPSARPLSQVMKRPSAFGFAERSTSRMIGTLVDLRIYAALLGLESQRVIGLRLMQISAGGAAAYEEAQLMVLEKATALAEAAALVATGGSACGVIRHYRRHVRANARRLSRRPRNRAASPIAPGDAPLAPATAAAGGLHDQG
jgi:hypothetical protein